MKTPFLKYVTLALTIGLSLNALTACKRSGPLQPRPLSEYEEKVQTGITLPELVKRIGPPLKDIGSGIHVYVYPVDDGTQILIGYTNHVLYARQVSGSGMALVKTLTEESSGSSSSGNN